jgi:diadenosine tetraphosphate (Ap4A) HIT family hydrolase
MDFPLHPLLQKDTVPVARFPGARLLLMDDSRFAWCILVPDGHDLRELHELAPPHRSEILELTCSLAECLQRAFGADKMNIAALGNLVPQLHIHIIARHVDDAAWPAPVWGRGEARAYTPAAREAMLQRLRACIAHLPGQDAG